MKDFEITYLISTKIMWMFQAIMFLGDGDSEKNVITKSVITKSVIYFNEQVELELRKARGKISFLRG